MASCASSSSKSWANVVQNEDEEIEDGLATTKNGQKGRPVIVPAHPSELLEQKEAEQLKIYKERWREEQLELKKGLVLTDAHEWKVGDGSLKYLGGVDISFVKDNDVDACAALVVIEFPSLKVVYEDYTMVQLTLPYISGFLGFREVPFLKEKLEKLKSAHPKIYPQVLLVDGNGILHHQGFGLACHLGVLLDLPTIGVAKKLLYVDGLSSEKYKPRFHSELTKRGDYIPLEGDSKVIWGAAMRVADDAPNPVFVSLGHKISLEVALDVVLQCSRYRVPEPIRMADLGSRAYLRNVK